MHVFKHPLWSRFTTIARPFFQSEARTKAIGGFVLLAVLLLAVNGMNFLNSYIMRDFMTALEKKQMPRFYFFGLALAGVFGLAAITYVSVGDAAGLQPYHDLWLELYGEGRWRLHEVDAAMTQERRAPANEQAMP